MRLNTVRILSAVGIIVSVYKGLMAESMVSAFPFIVLFAFIAFISPPKEHKTVHKKSKNTFKFVPLDSGYMGGSIVGFLISVMYIYHETPDWGVAFAIVFLIMFIASVISMTTADPESFIELEERFK